MTASGRRFIPSAAIRTPRALYGALLLLAVASLAGCIATPPATDRVRLAAATSKPTIEWPAVETADLDQLAAIAPRELSSRSYAYESVNGRATLTRAEVPEFRVIDAARAGVGVIRAVAPTDPLGRLPDNAQATLEFICVPGSGDSGDLFGREGVNRPQRMFACIDISFALPECDPPRGVIVALRPATRSPLDLSVYEELLRAGWAMIELSSFPLHPSPRPLDLRSDEDLDRFARFFAAGIDGQHAYCAYAAEAALDYITHRVPTIPHQPVVLVGMSMGALSVPTVAARLGDRVAAAVIIAGGADIMRITCETVFRNRGVQVLWQGHDPPRAVLDKLSEAYLHYSRLDAYHTAPLLADRPVLLIDGSLDTYVPPRTATLLAERLARPERWTWLTGHEGLFMLLPLQRGAIHAWIERQVATSAKPQ